ncbi:MAG: hypothetical protein ACI4MH_06460 [Candidatus Coproplasma sp.]
MSKIITVQLDDDLIINAENILDDLGLDHQTFIRMCFKRLNKEQSISFLTIGSTQASRQETNQTAKPESQEVSALESASLQQTTFTTFSEQHNDTFELPSFKTKGTITAEMRDYVWELFKSQYNAQKRINCSTLAKIAENKIGITHGSAYIYFLFLNNLVIGIPNTRTMKYEDLVVYMEYIRQQLPKSCLENALRSLTNSIPYWEEKLSGYFAQKVSALILQIKNQNKI